MAAFFRCVDVDGKTHTLNIDHVVRTLAEPPSDHGPKVSIFMTPVGSFPAVRVTTDDPRAIDALASVELGDRLSARDYVNPQ